MKSSFKKIISLFLTVLMLVGTVTMLVPITASAANDEPVYLEKNKTASINGITYRFDTTNADDAESWARVNPDGSWEVSIRSGDMLWFPEIEMTDSSKIYAEVTNAMSGPINHFPGLAYGVVSSTDSTYTATNVAVVRTWQNSKARFRATGATRDQIKADAGSGKVTNWEVAVNSAWSYVENTTNHNWDGGKTIYHKISQTSDKVVLEYGNPEKGVFTDPANTSYARDLEGMYAYAGGSVGYTMIWSEGKHYQFRIEDIQITNCKVAGVETEFYSVSGKEPHKEPVYLEKNKTASINGITYRFDTTNADDAESWARVNPDGSWEVSIRSGDMLWFPEIEMTDSSKIYAEVTNAMSGPINHFPGLAYGVVSSTDSTYTATNVAVVRTWQNSKARFRATGATRDQIKADAGSGKVTNWEVAVNSAWSYVENTTNHNWDGGKTIYHKISQTSEKVVLEFGSPEKGVFTEPANTSYANTDSTKYAYAGGSVGYTMVWSEGNHYQFIIHDITITNCKVGGVDKASYSVKALAPTVDKEAKISLSLDGTIGLNFSINANNLKDATIVAKKNGVEVVNQAVVNGENLVAVPVNAKEMTDTINVAIMQNGEVFGGHSYTTSVSEYAEQLLNDEEWGDLMSAMLNYGAAAQKLLDYKADEADVSGVADYDFTAVNDVDFGDGSIKDVLKGLYMNLDLESNTVLNLYFMPADGTALTVTVNGIEAVPVDNGDGYYVVSTEGIAADKLGEDITIVVNGTYIFKVNALNWAKIASSDADADVATLADALAAYASCAKEIFEKK